MSKNQLLTIVVVVAVVLAPLCNIAADETLVNVRTTASHGVSPSALKEKAALVVDTSIPIKDTEPGSLVAQIDSLLAHEVRVLCEIDVRSEAFKQKTWSWKNRPSLKQIFTWTKGAFSRLISAHKSKMKAVVGGAVCVALGATLLYVISNSDQLDVSSLSQLLPHHLAVLMGKGLFVSLCHEVGHTFVQYLMNGHIADIYLGTVSPEEYLNVLPGVYLGGIDPNDHAHMMAYLGDMVRLRANEAIAIKKSVLLELAIKEGSAGRSLEDLEKTPEYGERVVAMTHAALAGNRKKIAAFYAAGPIAGLISNVGLKALSGESLSSLGLLDFNELCNLLPIERSDGSYIVEHLGGEAMAARAREIMGKIEPWVMGGGMIGYAGKILYDCGVFNVFPDSMHNTLAMIGNTLRACGILAISAGSVGLVNIDPATV